jgi:hypothetical protein
MAKLLEFLPLSFIDNGTAQCHMIGSHEAFVVRWTILDNIRNEAKDESNRGRQSRQHPVNYAMGTGRG